MSHTDDATLASTPARGSARDHILEAAQRLFAERGFDGVSISDIAQETGASKANIFHHFGSKEGLYRAVIAAIVARAPDHSAAFSHERDAVKRFQETAAAELKDALNDETGARLILQEIISGSPMRSRMLAEEIFAETFLQHVERIRAEQAAGTLRRDIDPALAAMVLRSATTFFILGRRLLRHLPGVTFSDDPELYAREATALILRGLVATDSK
jgi:TetR/AcrR family transcriptional regulator